MATVQEPCSPKLRACVDDLIAQGKPESSAWAICRSQIGESHRHRDFQRILDEFINYYGKREMGEREYYAWLRSLQLDEAQMYGAARESFRWAKDMLQYLREDRDNKYYQVLLGFPLRSMNGNVYRERDLIAAALSLKGTHPSLNHKDAFWFTPRSRYGAITVVDAKYEDGALETIIQVPKSTVCPICDGRPMHELIDDHRIVNVSLEGECVGGVCYDGSCEGFTFTDPPFTLLTSDVLPGIPLARIKPLEAIMVEALHASTTEKKENTVKTVIKPKIIEHTANTADQTTPNVNTGSRSDPNFKGTTPTPVDQDAKIDTQNDLASTAVGTPAYADNTSLITAPATHSTPHHTVESSEPEYAGDPPSTGSDTSMPKPDDIRDGPPRTSPPKSTIPHAGDLPLSEKPEKELGDDPPGAKPKVPVGDSPTEQNEAPQPGSQYCMEHPDDPRCVAHRKAIHGEQNEEPCPEGQHRDADGNCVDDEPSDTLPSLEERTARIKAELKAKSAEQQAVIWEQKFTSTYTKLGQTNAVLKETRRLLEKTNLTLHNTMVNEDRYKKERDALAGLKLELEHRIEDLQRTYDNLNAKYQKTLDTNLLLSKKVTQANEDYLDVAKKLEDSEEALGRAKVEAKKIVRIKA